MPDMVVYIPPSTATLAHRLLTKVSYDEIAHIWCLLCYLISKKMSIFMPVIFNAQPTSDILLSPNMVDLLDWDSISQPFRPLYQAQICVTRPISDTHREYVFLARHYPVSAIYDDKIDVRTLIRPSIFLNSLDDLTCYIHPPCLRQIIQIVDEFCNMTD